MPLDCRSDFQKNKFRRNEILKKSQFKIKSTSLFDVDFSNKKASLGNSLVWLGFDWVGATGFEPAT